MKASDVATTIFQLRNSWIIKSAVLDDDHTSSDIQKIVKPLSASHDCIAWVIFMLVVLVGSKSLFKLMPAENLEELSVVHDLGFLVIQGNLRRVQSQVVKLSVDLLSQRVSIFLLDLAFVKQLVLDEVVLVDQEIVLGSPLLDSSRNLRVLFLYLV